ncbi:MAG: hypothetical protein ACFFG0_07675 [Candidatus Thorarchaeota archaeon]
MNELSEWLVKHFINIKGSADTADSSDINNDLLSSEEVFENLNNNKTPLEDLNDLLTSKIKKALKSGADITIFQEIFDDLIKFILENIEVILNQEKFSLKEFTDIYLSSLYDLEKEEIPGVSKFDPYQQFSPETIDYICNAVAMRNDILDFINVEYWEGIYSHISETQINMVLLFSIRSLIAFLKLIRNKNERIKGFKS